MQNNDSKMLTATAVALVVYGVANDLQLHRLAAACGMIMVVLVFSFIIKC
jgi:hypothetical protein